MSLDKLEKEVVSLKQRLRELEQRIFSSDYVAEHDAAETEETEPETPKKDEIPPKKEVK
jgi:hypothetical protein